MMEFLSFVVAVCGAWIVFVLAVFLTYGFYKVFKEGRS